MKISRLLIEKDCLQDPISQQFQSFFTNVDTKEIDNIDEVFGRVKKNYLEKREALQVFIGKKRGQLIKEAPNAYGQSGEKHFYFVHAYNCIYECEYCYLQGYFHSPDLVVYTNHDEIRQEMKKLIEQESQGIWFHAGEFSDSLALSHITKEWDAYWDFFANYPKAKLELRTKSANLRALENLDAQKNCIISFSLSPQEQVKKYDHKTASLKARLSAISKLAKKSHPIGIHLDPVIYTPSFLEDYRELLNALSHALAFEQITYVSLGVVRFSKKVFHQLENNYPDSSLLSSPYTKSFDGKIRYSRAMRLYILKSIEKLCLEMGFQNSQIYLCMEDDDL